MTRPEDASPSETDADGEGGGTLARYTGIVAAAVLSGCSVLTDRAVPLDRESAGVDSGRFGNRMGEPSGVSPTPTEAASETASSTPTDTASPTRTVSPQRTDTSVTRGERTDNATPEPTDESSTSTPTETARPAPETESAYGGAGSGSDGGGYGGGGGGSYTGSGGGAAGGGGGGNTAVAPSTTTPQSTTETRTSTPTSTPTPTPTPTGPPAPEPRTPYETVGGDLSAPLTGTVAVSGRETGYLCHLDTGTPVSLAFAGETVDGGSVNWHLADATALGTYWEGSEESMFASFPAWSAFDFGPFTTGDGGTALLVEPVDSPVTLSYSITVR